jgi:hypothetical protein
MSMSPAMAEKLRQMQRERDALRAVLIPFAIGPCYEFLHDDGKTVKCGACEVCRARAVLNTGGS